MSRPTYETDTDRSNELVVAAGLATSFRLRLERLPQFYPLDAALTDDRGRIATLLEIKCRSSWYPTMWVSAKKVAAAGQFHAIGIQTLFAWAVRDGEAWVVRGLPFEPSGDHAFVMGGRTDRNDPGDREPLWSCPQTSFTFERRVNV